jgi:hypothetical protein
VYALVYRILGIALGLIVLMAVTSVLSTVMTRRIVQGPIWSALAVGYAVIGLDGQVYLTDAGAEYLAWAGAAEPDPRAGSCKKRSAA